MKGQKKLWGAITVVALLLIGGGYYMAVDQGFVPAPFKVTDPNNPHFDPMRFRFEDYKSKRDIESALRTMFSVGETQTNVERILLKQAGATVKDRSTKVKQYAGKHDCEEYVSVLYEYRNVKTRLMNLKYMAPSNEFNIRVSIAYCHKDLSVLGIAVY